ncbi:hypothetical protein [Nocardiopsis kunsanensis]|uniref:Plectin n=1 Tax=Nocardiopsis kunsanensis TaxID=141693 RepID=A0A918X7R8_9ACTN|nr:hypothetical protein [Nocardiopsis kunsanensis]GHD17288.1 hypothetical protein GCM10007147_06280 [Nocardiopsis kunsanensis]
MSPVMQSREQAMQRLAEDQERADRLPGLMRSVSRAQSELEAARGQGASAEEVRHHGLELDTALTEAMRAAYAKERILVGSKGYTDRIHRRKRLAKPAVRRATEEAEKLLTAREDHRLHGIQRIPRNTY